MPKKRTKNRKKKEGKRTVTERKDTVEINICYFLEFEQFQHAALVIDSEPVITCK